MKKRPFLNKRKPTIMQQIGLSIRKVLPITVLAQHEETIIYRDSVKLKRKYGE